MPAQGVAYLGHAVPDLFPLDWADEAACRPLDTKLFFSEAPHAVALAKGTCARCPVRRQCRETADRIEGSLSGKLVHGIWGGETSRERIHRRRSG